MSENRPHLDGWHPENYPTLPQHELPRPQDWRARPSAGAWVLVCGVLVLVCAVASVWGARVLAEVIA